MFSHRFRYEPKCRDALLAVAAFSEAISTDESLGCKVKRRRHEHAVRISGVEQRGTVMSVKARDGVEQACGWAMRESMWQYLATRQGGEHSR